MQSCAVIFVLLLPSVLGITYTPGTDTCEGRCLDHYDLYNICQCTENCEQFGDCCLDFYLHCVEPEVPADSCQGRCGQFSSSSPCQCNDGCVTYGDCCEDYEEFCGDGTDPDLSCNGRCGNDYNPSDQCHCNDQCEQYNNCCNDYVDLCTSDDFSCRGKCFADYDSSLECQCNTVCGDYGNCCPDYEAECFSNATCKGRCSVPIDSNWFCECVDGCDVTDTCCDDYTGECVGTCDGRCDLAYDSSQICQCNEDCLTKGDCCADFSDVCRGGTGPQPISNEDIANLAEMLWANDVNRLINATDYVINKQSKTDENSDADISQDRFFTSLNESALTSRTFTTFIALLDNYIATTRQEEIYTLEELAEIEDFLDAVFDSDVMNMTTQFLIDKGWHDDEAGFRDFVKEVWFGNYSRKESDPFFDSSGFEHVFVGETRSDVTGFHNWLQFYFQEKAGALNYYGYVGEVEPDQIATKFNWNGVMKDYGSIIVGASPEFELAMFSLCFRVKPGRQCPFTLDGMPTRIQTYVIRDKYIGSAYFVV
ncbi:uncharacterized protein [Diadema setosum]|uniref:uncharacterized protein n=1 Tax=Diadema setosum TaxID=31175 RepID=UPI003B3ADC58